MLHEEKVNEATVTDILLDTEYSWTMTKHELIEERDMTGIVTINKKQNVFVLSGALMETLSCTLWLLSK